MQEKVSLTVFKQQSVHEAVEILKKIGFPPLGEPVAISGGDESHRTIAFLIHPAEPTASIEAEVANMLGIVRCTSSTVEGLLRLNVTYNCEIVKGREISDTV
jgi:hypothetical protein